MPDLQVVLRYLVFAAFAASVLVALASWLVRTRRISPFGPLGRTLRAASDPLIRPIEARLVRVGGNPVHAGWWLAVAVAVAGVLLITLWNLLVDTAYGVAAAYTEGPRGAMVLAVVVAYRILVAALVVRVIAGWFGYFRYSRWVRPAYALTDWLVEPIRRVLPPAGGFDWSPLAAWLALWVLKRVLLTVVVGGWRPSWCMWCRALAGPRCPAGTATPSRSGSRRPRWRARRMPSWSVSSPSGWGCRAGP